MFLQTPRNALVNLLKKRVVKVTRSNGMIFLEKKERKRRKERKERREREEREERKE